MTIYSYVESESPTSNPQVGQGKTELQTVKGKNETLLSVQQWNLATHREIFNTYMHSFLFVTGSILTLNALFCLRLQLFEVLFFIDKLISFIFILNASCIHSQNYQSKKFVKWICKYVVMKCSLIDLSIQKFEMQYIKIYKLLCIQMSLYNVG